MTRSRFLDEAMTVERLIDRVERPTRYVGNEWNSCHPSADAEVRTVLVYPDLYEIGSSNLGLQILYERTNDLGWASCERAYAPGHDLREMLHERRALLFSLESRTPLAAFDVIGVTLQTEMSYTTILDVLRLGGIPVEQGARDVGAPLVVGGGPCAFNPEPIADAFDALVIGDGEETWEALLDEVRRHKRTQTRDRAGLLRMLAQIPGVYVPSLYRPTYDRHGALCGVEALSGAPAVVRRAYLTDLSRCSPSIRQIVPYLQVTHDRAQLEIMRGCTRGCRFCQAGMVYRPLRERSAVELADAGVKLLRSTGYEELGLVSLSTADHSGVVPIIESLLAFTEPRRVSVSLPSLRADAFSVELAKLVARTKRTGLTFAPEAATERLRRAINKSVSDEDIENALAAAFTNEWTRVKLYFMIGLPTETNEDIDGIVTVARRAREIGLECLPRSKRGRLSIAMTVSVFVPKSHTPFQWEAQIEPETAAEKGRHIRAELRGRDYDVSVHDPWANAVEGVLARGDRRLFPVLQRLHAQGVRLETWTEEFSYPAWQRELGEVAIKDGTAARRDTDILPWDHISSGVDRDWLRLERDRAYEEVTTPDCRDVCTACGVCHDEIRNVIDGGSK